MILIVLAVLAVLSVPATGRNLARVAEIELRLLWVAPLALALQVVIVTVAPGGNHSLHVAVHLATYALAATFLWANRRLPGVPLLGAGAMLNALVISLNAGVMPQSATAHRLAGLVVTKGFQNSAVLAHPTFPWLGDVIPVPAPFGLGNALSIGDCLIYAGLMVLLHRTCARPRDQRPVEGGLRATHGSAAST